MSDSLGMKAVSRVDETDREPFLKALAHIAVADDSVTIDEKEMVEQYAEAWDLGDRARSVVKDILEAGSPLDLDHLVSEFSESGTRFLLMQELMRLAYADGTYGDVERRQIAAIAQRMDMTEEQFREVEKWVGRGRAWGDTMEEGVPGEDELEGVLNREEDEGNDYDLSDIETGDSDLSDLTEESFGGEYIDEEGGGEASDEGDSDKKA